MYTLKTQLCLQCLYNIELNGDIKLEPIVNFKYNTTKGEETHSYKAQQLMDKKTHGQKSREEESI